MITESSLYWMTRLDEIKSLLAGIGILTSFITIVFLLIGVASIIVCYVETPEKAKTDTGVKTLKKVCYFSALVLFLGIVLNISNVFIPTTKQYAMIKVIPAIANDPKIQQEASEIYDMAKQALKKTLQIPNLEKPKAEEQRD